MTCLAALFALALPLAATLRAPAPQSDWKTDLKRELPLLGHRNWIVIADSAYPWQTSLGVETVDTRADQIEVTKAVLEALGHVEHVRPIIFMDSELPFVPEKDAKGVEAYRKEIATVLGSRKVTTLPHEQIISKLDEAGKTFHVLLLKTKMTIPYTSVFMQLNCGYWSDEAEQRMREAIAGHG